MLVYHRIAAAVDDPCDIAVQPHHFAEQLEILNRWGAAIHVREIPALLARRTLPRRAFAVTFDDGYLDNLLVAMPLLEAHDVPATVFAASAFAPGGREYWWMSAARLVREAATLGRQVRVAGRVLEPGMYKEWETTLSAAKPEVVADTMRELRREIGCASQSEEYVAPMTTGQLQQLVASGLIDVGAHTVNHRRLALLSEMEQREEIVGSKRELEEALGRAVETFAYPFGFPGTDFTTTTRRLVMEAGFSCSVAVNPGPVLHATDPYMLPRCWVSDWEGDEFERRLRGWFSR